MHRICRECDRMIQLRSCGCLLKFTSKVIKREKRKNGFMRKTSEKLRHYETNQYDSKFPIANNLEGV